MRTWLAVLALLPLQDRAERFFEGLRFAEASPESERGRRVHALLTDKRHWLEAHRAIEARLGPMKERIDLAVSFDHEGEEAAKAAAKGGVGRIRFNLKRLEEFQEKVDELERLRKEAAATGRRLVVKVAPTRLDRVIWHEMTHIFHADYEAPEWFTEGLAQWLSEDPSALQAFAHKGGTVEPIEDRLFEKQDVYPRGQLFWSWVAARGAVKRVVEHTILAGAPWRSGLEKALGLSWSTIWETEWDWSEKQLAKYRK